MTAVLWWLGKMALLYVIAGLFLVGIPHALDSRNLDAYREDIYRRRGLKFAPGRGPYFYVALLSMCLAWPRWFRR